MQEVIEGFQLSPQQRRLWSIFQAQRGRGCCAWVSMGLQGKLDIDELRKALDEVVRRHEILRTRVVSDPRLGVALQVIGEDRASWAPVEDWSGVSCEEIRSRADAFMEEQLREFAGAGPLVLVSLIRTKPQEHLLNIRVSSLAADTTTMLFIARETALEYAGGPAKEPLQYADLSEWENELLESPEAAPGLEHWRDQGRADEPWGTLPFEEENLDPPWPSMMPIRFEPELLRALTVVADQLSAPLSRLLLTCWFLLLHRLTLRSDLVVSVAFDGRELDDLKEALGPLARSIPVRCQIEPQRDLAAVAAKVGRAVEEAARWQDYFAQDQPAHEKLRFSFSWCSGPSKFSNGGLTWNVLDRCAVIERCRLSMICERSDEELRVRLLYDGARFSAAEIERLKDQLLTHLRSITTQPKEAVGRFQIVDRREQEHLLRELSRGPEEDPLAETGLADLLDRPAVGGPDRIAVRFEDELLTFAALRGRVGRLASYLRARSVGPEVRVGLLLGRSLETLVAMLAVLRSGGTYVPLDPASPKERLSFMLRDAGISLLLTTGSRQESERLGSMTRVVRLDADAGQIARESSGAPPCMAGPNHLAYIIYTSGTTGQPKGVAIERRSLACYIQRSVRALNLPREGKYALVSTFSADLGNTVLFPALYSSSTLHILSRHRTLDPDDWAEYASRHRIDTLKIVPSHLKLLMEVPEPDRALPLRRLVLGGEACDWELIKRVRDLAPECEIFNHYGPTESTVGVVAGGLADEMEGLRAPAPPLGRPFPGARIYILDTQGHLAPTGVPGELYIGGDTLARGYINHPALTAKSFLPDPFSESEARMYRTGDLACFLSDDRITFLGRVDEQVKLSGFRVEPGEIEKVLSEHPKVKLGRVVAREKDGRKSLVAYVVTAQGKELVDHELRRFLQKKLPDHMIPADLVLLDRLPLTANGKLDFRALACAQERAVAVKERTPPQNPIEASLLRIWEEILGKKEIGTTDDFFELGGNSFIAVQLMSRIRKELDCRLPLATLIASGTVREIARLLPKQQSNKHRHLVTIQGGAQPTLYCVHPGEGTVLCYRELARHLDDDREVCAFQALDMELGRAPSTDIAQMAAQYLEEMAARESKALPFLAGWSFGGLVAFEMARQLREQGKEILGLLLIDCRLPVTATALSRIDPEFLRISMLFHSSRLVKGGKPVVSAGELRGLAVNEQMELIAQRVGVPTAGLLPAHVPPDQVEDYLETRMARVEAIRKFRWRKYPGPITLFRASEVDLDTPFPQLREAYREAERTPDYGWGNLSSEPVEVIAVPGTHHTMLTEPNVREFGRQMSFYLQTQASAPGSFKDRGLRVPAV